MINVVDLAEQVARASHEGQVDKIGHPYIEHPARVARSAAGAAPADIRDAVCAVGWLHDVVEDTQTDIAELRAFGFSEEILAGVEAMTKRSGEAPEAYFARVRANILARLVKAADIDDNTSPKRVAQLDADTRDRLAAKYQRSRELLHAGLAPTTHQQHQE